MPCWMDRSTNFNMTICCTVMSKNIAPEDLSAEMAAIPGLLKNVGRHEAGAPVIVARVARGLSCESWREVFREGGLENWHAWPVSSEVTESHDLEGPPGYALPVTPFREVAGALTSGMFASLLKRELLRMGRNGGCLSLVTAALSGKGRVGVALGEGAVARLEAMLGSILLSQLEACDALGLLRSGQYICSLPGLGQLGARGFAEKAQQCFVDTARPYFPSGGISAGQGAGCAIGIVNILQGEGGEPAELIKRAKMSLEVALSKEEGHIHQESALSPLEGATLVHSSEKRFLFFGGN